MKYLKFLLLLTCILSGCSSQPVVNNTNENETHFLTKIDYYQSFLGKPVPANYKRGFRHYGGKGQKIDLFDGFFNFK